MEYLHVHPQNTQFLRNLSRFSLLDINNNTREQHTLSYSLKSCARILLPAIALKEWHREVNKNNLLGGQFFNIFGQKFAKIINWVGSLRILSTLTQIMCFPPKTLRCVTLSMPSSADTHCRISWTRVLRSVDIVQQT